jgi:hypothetical protein
MAYGFDADTQVVWIDSLAEAIDARHGVLCRRHADAMVVPLGWMLDDRRVPTPQLFPTGDPTPVAGSKVRSAATRRSGDAGEQLALDASSDLSYEVGDDAHHSTSSERAAPWKPVFDQTDDLDGLLGAQSPLLSRAFRGRARRSR